jgi:hypothetical protein
MRRALYLGWLAAIPSIGFAQSPDTAAAITQAQANLRQVQSEIPRAMMEVKRLADQVAVDKATMEAQLDTLRNGQPMPTPAAPQPEGKLP